MKHTDSCPVTRAARLIGDTWTLLIVRDLMSGCKRFSQLQQSLGAVSPKTLSQRLGMLEAAGLITRQAYAEIPPRVEYALTEKGYALLDVIRAIREFGERWLCEPTPLECQGDSS